MPKALDKKKIRETSELEKKQRKLEREVRKLKRLEAGCLDETGKQMYRQQLKGKQAELRGFISDHSETLRREYWREKDRIGTTVKKLPIHDVRESAQKELEKPLENGIIKANKDEMADKDKIVSNDVHSIGVIDIEKYKAVSEKKIITDEVVITDNRIKHIIERRGQEFYDEYCEYFPDIIANPDYIFKDEKENTAIATKSFTHKGSSVNIVLRLAVEGDNPEYKNSIITAIKENDKRFAQRLRNNKLVYRIDNKE